MVKKHPVHKEVVCPFCSLLCDDLAVEDRDGRLAVLENGCPRAERGFEAAPRAGGPLIDGRAAGLDEAVAAAARLLRRSRHPLISGLGTDVAGSRSAMLLAEKAGAVIDHGQGDAAVRNLLVLQESGWIMTTLTELKNRADFVLFLGTDAASRYPRFFERYIWNRDSLFLDKTGARHIAYIGQRLDTRPGTAPGGRKPLSINCRKEELLDYVSLLSTLLAGQDFASETISRAQRRKVETLLEQMRTARYGVIVWSPGELDLPHAELLVQSVCDLVRQLNRKGRFAGLALGGDHGGTSFSNVCAWQSGFPLRVDYRRKAPRYDPYGNATQRLLDDGVADALLWIAAYGTEPARPRTKIPAVVLSPVPDQDAHVSIPVGTPGLDHGGNLFRTDSVVSLPLRRLREPRAGACSDILDRITRALTT